MNFVDSKVEAYAQNHSTEPSTVVNHIFDWTVNNSESPQMLTGALQGAVLRMLVQLVGARRVLEIGMFTGYSALTMAEVLPDDGQLITLEIDPERAKVARAFFNQSPHGKKIKIRLGSALESIPNLEGPFDFVFVDADKENYLNYYASVLPLVSKGGIIAADNVLWSSSVLDPKTESARSLDEFNKTVQNDARVSNVLLTVRDGLMVVRKN